MIVGATGHRPGKLGGYSPAVQERVVTLAHDWLECFLPAQVLTGMALGWDQAVAKACRRLDVPFVAMVPFEGQESKWPAPSQAEYRRLLGYAAEVRICSPGGYTPFAMHLRNQRIVQGCDLLLALWDGSAGGTASCVYEAQKYGARRPIVNLWPRYTVPA